MPRRPWRIERQQTCRFISPAIPLRRLEASLPHIRLRDHFVLSRTGRIANQLMSENILPFPKTADAAFVGGAAVLPANVIPFPAASAASHPASNIVVLPSRAFISGGTSPAPELPGDDRFPEKNARLDPARHVPARALRRGHHARKRPSRRGLPTVAATAGESPDFAGTSGAGFHVCMDPATPPARPAGESEISHGDCRDEQESFRADGSLGMETPAREPDAMEWHEGRPARGIDRSAPEFHATLASYSTATADRIFLLLLREALLARQYGSDSMAVLLRPDDDTELVLHLAQHHGRLEATVRCERGDLPLLRASWAQVQETMAMQRVDVRPLQEPLAPEAPFRGGELRSDVLDASPFVRPSSETDSTDEWPASADNDVSPAHRRDQRDSGGRLLNRRPGWETWA